MARKKTEPVPVPEKTIGQKLRLLIDWSGLTDAEVARRAGVSKQALSRIVTDQTDDIKLTTLKAILAVVGKDLCDFDRT